jgi:nucleolar protein 56
VPELAKITLDEDVARAVYEASRTSMGMDISEVDLANVDHFTGRLVALAQYRQQLHEYLTSKMHAVAPNLAALIGEVVGARLISHAGSLTNLAKAPASTVQILGAEKALFRALKTKGNTPKYGLIFHSSFIGRAAAKNKGRISRYLANKCAIAARIDSFSDKLTSKFGEKLKDQVEDRLAFYETGAPPKRNLDVMHSVMEALAEEEGSDGEGAPAGGAGSVKKAKKEKKEKKRKAADLEAAPRGAGEEVRSSKKKKRAASDDE